MLESITKIAPFKVFVRCNTYNQSSYIKDALKGFVMQKTNFPFICMIMDDCSTDGEQELLLEWAKEECENGNLVDFEIEDSRVVFARHKENANCYFAFYLLKRNTWKEREVKIKMYEPWRAQCEYEALCEGDDYWTNPLKLQKQVDFLESHHEYTGVYTNTLLEDGDGILTLDRFGNVKDDFDLPPEMMIEGGGGVVRTVSDMHRIDVMSNYPEFIKKCMIGDYPLHIYLSLVGKCRMLVEPMVVYRTAAVGSWSTGKKKRSIQQEIAVRQNFNEMLDNFDEYSDWKYHSSVVRTETFEVYDLLIKNKSHWRLISKSFQKVIANFRGMRKVDNFLMTHHLSWIYYVLWEIRVWRGKRIKQ